MKIIASDPAACALPYGKRRRCLRDRTEERMGREA